MEFRFEHIDNYEFLCPKEKFGHGIDLKNFIQNYFTKIDRKDLIFSIVETTSRNNINHIGETLIWTPFTDKTAKELLAKYKNIIIEIGEKFNDYISEFDDWYEQKSYILIVDNNLNKTYSTSSWNNEDGKISEPKPGTNSTIKSHIGREFTFQEYLKEYGEKVHNELGLKNFPHYCIIAKPIALPTSNGDFLPVGNLYLIFATKNKKTEDYYIEFINNFLLVWIYSKWEIILNEINKTKNELQYYFPKLRSTPLNTFRSKKGSSNNTLEQIYTTYFGNSSNVERLKGNLNTLSLEVFDFFKYYSYLSVDLPEGIKEKIHNGGKGALLNSSSFTEEFERIIAMRFFTTLTLTIFKIDIQNLHSLCDCGNVDCLSNSESAIYNFFHEQRWLMLGSKQELVFTSLKVDKKVKSHSRIQRCLLGALSDFETDQLSESIDLLLQDQFETWLTKPINTEDLTDLKSCLTPK